MDTERTVVALIATVLMVGFIVLVGYGIKGSIEQYEKKRDLYPSALEIIANIRYLIGHPDLNAEASVSIYVLPDEFAIHAFETFERVSDKIKAHIPKKSIKNISIEDHSKFSDRITISRLFFTGGIGMFVPKGNFFVTILWADSHGMEHNTVFKFTGVSAGNEANTFRNTLIKHLHSGEPTV